MAIKRAPIDDDDAPAFDTDPPRARPAATQPPVQAGRTIKRAEQAPASGVVARGAPPTPPPADVRPAPTGMMRVVRDARGVTAIELRRESGDVLYISFDVTGVSLSRMPRKQYDETWREIAGYPIVRAATLYLGWAQHLGITDDALKELKRIAPGARMQDEAAARENYGKPRGVASVAPKYREPPPQIGKIIR